MKIYTGQHTFKVLIDNEFKDIKHYANSFYSVDQIENVTKEIEQEYPEYKNKIMSFELILENES